MSEFWKIDAVEQLSERLKFLEAHIRASWDWSKPVEIQVRPWSKKRSLNANALMHVWFREIGKYFTAKNIPLSEEDAKDLMKSRFLGLEDRVVNGKVIAEGQLRRTRSLTSGEQKQFMDQIAEWAADKGCALSHPEDSEYAKWGREHG